MRGLQVSTKARKNKLRRARFGARPQLGLHQSPNVVCGQLLMC